MESDNREARVLEAVVALVDSLLQDFDVVDLLTDLTERCADLLDVESSGLLLADPSGRLHLMTATSRRAEELELFQLQTEEGPCTDCYVSGEPVSVADLAAAQDRWPQFVPAAIAAGFASVHALPLTAAHTSLGALGLFGTTAGQLNDADLLVGRSLAHVASVTIVQEHSPTPAVVLPRLRNVLARQVVVEQAKGFLRERLGLSIPEAFAVLRQYSRRSGAHLSDVARSLVSDPDARPEILAGLTQLVQDGAAGG